MSAVYKRELASYDIRKNNDPRENTCTKFSKYLGKFYILNNQINQTLLL